MSFRKTAHKVKPINLAGTRPARDGDGQTRSFDENESNPAVRPSVLTSAKTISTGTPALDRLLRHGGLPLGSILLLEESGTTDFASAVLRCFAAFAISSGSYVPATKVFIVGAPDPQWVQTLPSIAYTSKDDADNDVSFTGAQGNTAENNRMKIAWRYQEQKSAKSEKTLAADCRYCPVMDMTKRSTLTRADLDKLVLVPPGPRLFSETLSKLRRYLEENKGSSDIVRVVIPLLLHPASYTSESSNPKVVLSFLNDLRQLCAKYPNRLAVIISIPLQIYPRTCGLVRWMELVCHGVVHIDPFQTDLEQTAAAKGPNQGWNGNRHPQGLVHVYKLPTLTETGKMVTRVSEDAFRLGKGGIEIEPWAIPVEEPQQESHPSQSHDF